ncbi:MAG: GNAT family N-acetyltransferase [Bdellovibrionales bacterium]|nr:GNAT family N-acetyltransferase [Bdellovibrionales bacterium]
MKINSLSNLTNMIFARNEGEIIIRESYIVIKTINNPTFHWGNYLIFKHAPKVGDLTNWMNIFQKEFSHYKKFEHYVFAWDDLNAPESPEYLTHNFSLEKSVSLATSSLNPPKHYNKDVVIRPLASKVDWEQADELQVATRDPKFSYDEYKEFKLKQSEAYHKLIAENRGARFGAFMGDILVADLGIYFEDKLARYQSVVTHPDYRGKGICGTLVFESGSYALKNWGVTRLAMEADPDYHAARIYESVGFLPVENSYALYWHKSQG